MGLVLIFTSYFFDFIADLAGTIVFILTQGVAWKFPFYGYFRADMFAPELVKWIGAPISILLGATALSLCYRHLTGMEGKVE